MTKETIGIGQKVDDGSGDYLRAGGIKINSNFEELYTDLGDGVVPHPAGAWKIVTAVDGQEIKPKFGQSFVINTTSAAATVILPQGGANDYGKVIRLRDVWGTWRQNPVTIRPSGSNTIKGGSASKQLYRELQDVELVFTVPGDWEYLNNKSVDRLSQSDINNVSKREYICTAGQTDFTDVFGDLPYNVKQVEVYRRGNLLYYGEEFSANSDYGSIGADGGAAGIVKLDGKSIRLRNPCNEGDVVTIITYMDGLSTHQTSYISKTITVFEETIDDGIHTSVPGKTWVGDLSTKRKWTLAEFGVDKFDGTFNPHSTEILINGRSLTMAGRGDLPAFACEDATGIQINEQTEESCIAAGGEWVDSGLDYSVLLDDEFQTTIIKIYQTLDDGDQLTVRWYNNDIGTTMKWEDIKANTDKHYLNNEMRVTRSKKLRYNDYSNPNPCTTEIETEVETNIRIIDVGSLLESVYPVGSVYMNAHNTNNPRDYMGFGTWVAYAKGQSIVGWDDGSDEHFSTYTGTCGTVKAPGGSGGEVKHTLLPSEMPTVSSQDKVLIKDPNGDVVIGQCQLDPDEDGKGPGYRTYREDVLNTNVNVDNAAFPVLQPYVTVAAWLRVA